MFPTISKEYLVFHEFSRSGIETEEKKQREFSGRFAADARLPMDDEKKTIQLRIELVNIIRDQFDMNFTQVEAKTTVKESTLRAYLNPHKKRRFQRAMIAKLVVGLQLSLEEADKLFILQGFALDPENVRLDAIVVNCVQSHEDIDDFYDTCKQFHMDIFKDIE